MTQYQVASQVVSKALRLANQSAEEPIDSNTLIALSGAVSTAVCVFGHNDKKAIRKSALKITPDFKLIEKTFFTILEEAPLISELTHDKNYDRITEFILEYPELSPEERLHLYFEEYASKSFKFWQIVKASCIILAVLGIFIHIVMYFSVPENRKKHSERCRKAKETVKNLKKHIERFKKAVNFVTQFIEK